MGEIRKRGRVYWVRYYRDGRRHEESSRSERKADAERLLALREGDIAKGVPVSAKIGQLRFDEAAKDFLNDYRVNGKRSEDVDYRLRLHLTPFFGGRRMASITTSDVRNYVRVRQDENAAAATINRELAALKRMFSLAVQAGKLLHRPHIPMLRENNTRTGFFEPHEFESVLSKLPEHLKPVVTFAYLTGWRVRSEVLSLEWRNVDRRTGVIRLDPGTTKNHEGRVLPYRAIHDLEALIEEQWAAKVRLETTRRAIIGFVFHHDGRPIRDFHEVWQRAALAAGYPSRIPHDFRRTAVRNLVRAGVSEHTAMKLTGHKTRSIFDRYDIVSESDLAGALDRLAVFHGEQPKTAASSGQVTTFARRRVK
jgi:integrase